MLFDGKRNDGARVLFRIEDSVALKRRKEIYKQLHPETKAEQRRSAGMNRALGNNVAAESAATLEPPTFVEEVSAQTGKSQRTIRDDVAIANALDEQAAEDIAGTPVADSKAELKRLGSLAPAKQRAAAKKIKSGEAKTVNEAVSPMRRFYSHLPSRCFYSPKIA
jgi:ParB family transcriptional regulator, chromosome partitioning protein